MVILDFYSKKLWYRVSDTEIFYPHYGIWNVRTNQTAFDVFLVKASWNKNFKKVCLSTLFVHYTTVKEEGTVWGVLSSVNL